MQQTISGAPQVTGRGDLVGDRRVMADNRQVLLDALTSGDAVHRNLRTGALHLEQHSRPPLSEAIRRDFRRQVSRPRLADFLLGEGVEFGTLLWLFPLIAAGAHFGLPGLAVSLLFAVLGGMVVSAWITGLRLAFSPADEVPRGELLRLVMGNAVAGSGFAVGSFGLSSGVSASALGWIALGWGVGVLGRWAGRRRRILAEVPLGEDADLFVWVGGIADRDGASFGSTSAHVARPTRLAVEPFRGLVCKLEPAASYPPGDLHPGEVCLRWESSNEGVTLDWRARRAPVLRGPGSVGCEGTVDALLTLRGVLNSSIESYEDLIVGLQITAEQCALEYMKKHDDAPSRARRTTVKDFDAAFEDAFREVALPEGVRDELRMTLKILTSDSPVAPSGLLLHGPPGTGKTQIARAIARFAQMPMTVTSAPQLRSSNVGATGENVRAVFEDMPTDGRSIVYIDEAEGVLQDRSHPSADQMGREGTVAFLAAMDGVNSRRGKVFVIASTNQPDMIDAAVRSRLGRSIRIGAPDREGRRLILEASLRRAEEDVEVTPTLLDESEGMVGRQLDEGVVRAVMLAVGEDRRLSHDDLISSIREMRRQDSTAVDEGADWDSIVLPTHVEEQVRDTAALLGNVEAIRSRGVRPPSGLLLHGPPGTGKTSIARILANESGLNFIARSKKDLEGQYVGHTAPLVARAFEEARSRAPAILFFDEMDAVFGAGGSAKGFSQDAIDAFKQEVEGIEHHDGYVFLLGSTNHPDRIDSAIRSRLGRELHIGLPDADGREAVARLWLRGREDVPRDVQNAAVQAARKAQGMSPRAIVQRLNSAEQRAAIRFSRRGAEGEITLCAEDVVGGFS